MDVTAGGTVSPGAGARGTAAGHPVRDGRGQGEDQARGRGEDQARGEGREPGGGQRPARPGGRTRRTARRLVRAAGRAPGRASVVAVAVWLAALPAAFAVPAALDPDPFHPRGALLPLAVGGCAVAVLAALAWWRRTETVAGAAAGTFAAWVALTLRTALNGTPFGFAGLHGDMGRIAAGATTYSTTAASTDAIVKGLPAEYPPLYTWLTGRAAALLDVPAWRLVGEAEVLTTSAAVLVAFLLWRRLVPAPVALAIAVAGLVAFGDPRKAYEVLTAAAFAPWAIMTFGRPSRGALGWPVAGLVGGLMVLTYQGFLVYGALGLAALLVLGWREAADRRAYVRHVGLVLAVAAAVASWYVLPYLATLVRAGGQQTADLFPSPLLTGNPFPFLEPTPLGALQLAGVAGMLWYRRSAWWARPLLVLVTGAYCYLVIMMVRFVLDGHTGFLHYTLRLLGPLLAAAGVLTAVRAVPGLLRRLAALPVRPRGVAAGALAVLALWGGLEYWRAAVPERLPEVLAGHEPDPFFTVRAHTEPLPGGRRTRHAPDGPRLRVHPFPAEGVRRSVAAVLGPRARPVTLSYDERLFAYLPWPGYAGVGRMSANTLVHWDARAAEVARLARATNPAELARASRTTRFGPIQVYVLRRGPGGTTWRWKGRRFRPAQFARPWFATTELPGGTVVAVRRDGPEAPGAASSAAPVAASGRRTR